MQFDKRVWDFCASQDLLHPEDRLVLGVSGGPDSLCLLDVFHRLAGRHGLALVVAHFNHGLRPEAEADAQFVQAEAARRGLTFVVETGAVRAAAAARHQSLEAAARILRYDFLLRAAQQTNASCVAVAHTADDQAETVLLRVLRGAGLRGMRGILPKRELGAGVSLVRPLLSMTRAEILAYCAEHGLTPRLDSSNADTHFARNRVRHELLPMLATYNPSVRAVLARTATVAAGDYEIWSEAMAQLWAETAAAPTHPAGQIAFERARWLALGRAQQRALLRLAAERLAGEQDEIDFSPLEAAVTFSRTAQPGRWCELAAGLRLKVEPAQLVVCRAPSEPEADAAPRLVAGALAPGWRLTVADADPNGTLEPAESRWTVFVDSDRLTGPLELRARRRGDRFQPLGLGGHTAKLSDFFVNQKIPVQQRDGWPLVTCGNAIVWVTGLRLDDRFRVTERSRRVTRLVLAPATTE